MYTTSKSQSCCTDVVIRNALSLNIITFFGNLFLNKGSVISAV